MGEPAHGICFLVSKLSSLRVSEVIDVGYSADYMQGTRMSFKSKEDAVHFAEKQGISLYLLPAF